MLCPCCACFRSMLNCCECRYAGVWGFIHVCAVHASCLAIWGQRPTRFVYLPPSRSALVVCRTSSRC